MNRAMSASIWSVFVSTGNLIYSHAVASLLQLDSGDQRPREVYSCTFVIPHDDPSKANFLLRVIEGACQWKKQYDKVITRFLVDAHCPS